MLTHGAPSPVRVSQKEHLVDIWINIFFGVGVIWTAIGMRGALMNGLGNLSAATAASQGAFAILERLVGGGILLALSTTIFGGVGGYLMRVVKAFFVGYELRTFYNEAADAESETVLTTLRQMEHHLSILSRGIPTPCGTRLEQGSKIGKKENERQPLPLDWFRVGPGRFQLVLLYNSDAELNDGIAILKKAGFSVNRKG